MNYALALSRQQAQFLLETVHAFVDNKKLLHLPDIKGDIIGLPLTEEALKFVLSKLEGEDGKKEFSVRLQHSGDLSEVRIEINGVSYEYKVSMEEFDEQ